jgi:hypothetical protein
MGLGITAAILAFVLYLQTLAPTVYGLDSAELTAGAYLLGIVHSPGSPTYLLLGHLFTWLPFGDIGYRVNLLSACAAALATGFVCAVLLRWTPSRLQALAGSLYLATTYYFWVTALAAELYALHAAFIAGLLWLGLLWQDRPTVARLTLLCFFYGVGLGNHLSLSILAPGFVLLVTAGMPQIWRRPRLLAAGAFALAAGWSVYLYLPIRAHAGVAMNYARDYGVDVTTWNGFWWMVTGRMFGREMFGVSVTELPSELASYLYRLWSNFLGLGCILGGIGLASDFKRRPQVHWPLLLMFLGHLIFVLTYSVGDKDLMLLPTFMVWGLWAVIGAGELARYIRERGRGRVAITAATLLAMMTAANVLVNFSRVDVSKDWSARNRGDVLLSWLPADTVYLAAWSDAALIDYFQLVEGRRADVRMLNTFLVRGARRISAVEEQIGRGGPVYASAPVALGKGFVFEFEETCGCYRVFAEQRPACFLGPPSKSLCEPSWWQNTRHWKQE